MRVGYRLGDDPVSIYSSSCVIKVGPVCLLLGGTMDVPRGTVSTLRGGSGVVHGINVIGTAVREILG